VSNEELKDLILRTLSDTVARFAYYDRKEDEDLPRGAIERVVADGVITVDELVDAFRGEVTSWLKAVQ
jgi:hypothetical protein